MLFNIVKDIEVVNEQFVILEKNIEKWNQHNKDIFLFKHKRPSWQLAESIYIYNEKNFHITVGKIIENNNFFYRFRLGVIKLKNKPKVIVKTITESIINIRKNIDPVQVLVQDEKRSHYLCSKFSFYRRAGGKVITNAQINFLRNYIKSAIDKDMLIKIEDGEYVKVVNIEDPNILNCLKLIECLHNIRKENDLDMQAENSNPIPEKIIINRNNKNPTEKNSIYDYYSINGFVFSDEIITRYVLSLMTKPFVILTGISGTGKTKIAQLFASYMLQECDKEEKKQRIAFVPVRPDWLDNKGLLGFFNILDEKYNATSVLKLLIAARDNPDKPYFVILDEMNLAKVEHYFSDFLSIMESRTPDNPQGEALVLHDRPEAYTHDGLLIPDRLHIPSNVYFTGTVNVDESTYMFSPKVLDRANVIEFNEVFLDHQVDNQTYSNSFRFKQGNLLDVFPLSEDQPFSSSNDYSECKDNSPHVVDSLSELHNKLKEHNMHFGYRVINEVCRFTRLANTYVSTFDSDTVLDIQVVQKILPKFHGTQAKLDEPLKKLRDFAQSPASLLTSRTVDYRLPRTSDKLTAMLDTLKTQGYADFIE